MKKLILITTGIIFLQSCTQGKEQRTNLSIFGTHFSKESSIAKNARNNLYNLLLEEQASISKENKEQYVLSTARIKKLYPLFSNAKQINEFIYNEQLAILDYKKSNRKGLVNDGDDFVFDFIEFHGQLKKHVIDLQKLKGLIDNFKFTVNKQVQDASFETQEFVKMQNTAYHFNKNKYELNTDPHEKLIILEEIESDFNQYAQAILGELAKSFDTNQYGFAFNQIEEVFIPESNNVRPGQEFIAKVMIVASNDLENKIVVQTNQGKIVSIENGIATIRYKAPASGSMELTGKITIRNKNGVPYTRDFSKKVSVGKMNSNLF
jgi:hypothetical protein